MALTTAWLWWALAAICGTLAVVAGAFAAFWRLELRDERKRSAALEQHAALLAGLLKVRAVQKAEAAGIPAPPPLPPPDPPLHVPRDGIMRRLTGVWTLPRFRLPGRNDEER
jgi:hypothetical protein